MDAVVSYLEEQAALTAAFFKEQAALTTRFQKEQAALYQRTIGNCKRASVGLPAEKKVRKKRVKDPNRPKRPLSGYQLFMAEYNNHYKAKHPESSTNEMMGILAKAWGVLEEPKKAEYLRRAAALKEEFLVQIKAYEERKVDSEEDNDDDSIEATAAQAAAAAIAAARETEKKKKHKESRQLSDATSSSAVPMIEHVAHGGEEEKKKKHKKHKKDKHQ